MTQDLTRRTFLETAAMVGIASTMGITPALASAETPATEAPQRKTSFDEGWSFSKGDFPNAQAPQYADSGWTKLNVPHDWSIAGPFNENEPSGQSGAYLPTGIGWYRKTFRLPQSDAGRRFTLQFDGVYQCSDVWINGQHLGYRPYGFSTLRYDLTPHLHFGNEPNVVAVRVNNSGQPNLRSYSGSGIYRHTWLINTEQVYIDQFETYVTTPVITTDNVTVEVTTRVWNQTAQAAACTLTTTIVDRDGSTMQTTETKASVVAGQDYLFVQRLSGANFARWSVETPHLYTARQVLSHDTAQVDATETAFGVRSIEFHVDKGFLLNGKHVKLNGSCLHSEGGAVGAAVPIRVWERRLRF